MIKSLWKLTLDPSGTPLVILNIGDAITEELEFVVSKGLEVVDLESSDAPFLRPNRNAVHSIEFQRRITVSTDIAARSALLGWQVTLEAYGKKPLKVEYSGENDYWTFGSAFVTAGKSRRLIESKDPAYVLTFSITATSLTKTVVA